MKGVFNINPPVAKYAEMWDPNQVLAFLRTWSPTESLTLKKLTLKLAMLILLTTGQRCHTLTLLSLDDMVVKDKHIAFYVKGLFKQSRPGYKNPVIILKEYPLDRSLCVFTYMKTYIKLTESIRDQEQKEVFLTYQRPHHPPSRDTISRWIKLVLKYSGIDITAYTAHSVRGASTSMAKLAGLPVEDILGMAGWSKENTFSKFYDRPIRSASKFAETVLGGSALLS